MPRRVETVQAAGHHRDRLPATTQRSAVGGAVDAVGAAGDHDLLRVRRIVGELAGDVVAVTRRCPRPGDRHNPALLRQMHDPRRRNPC